MASGKPPKAVKAEAASDDEEDEGGDQVEFYKKPGQTKPTPSPGAGGRVFYETLLQQKPGSLMALQWCVEHGVFDMSVAEDKYQLLLKLKADKAAGVKAPPAKRRKPTPKARGKVVDTTAFDPGMSAGGVEGVGTITM